MNFDLHRLRKRDPPPLHQSESWLPSYVDSSTAMGEKKIVGILPSYYVHVLDLVSLWMG